MTSGSIAGAEDRLRGDRAVGRHPAGSGPPRWPGARVLRTDRLALHCGATVTTSGNRDSKRKKVRGKIARRASSPRPRKAPERAAPAGRRGAQLRSPRSRSSPKSLPLPPVPLSAVETTFATRMPPPEPERPRPAGRRAIFLDVENTSKAQHLAHVIDHLGVDPWDRRTELIAVANWRVVGHDAARLLAQRGAHLVHSAPSTGVRDWSDLRIAVAAGIWLAAARPGDLIEIVSDDRAFDAVGRRRREPGDRVPAPVVSPARRRTRRSRWRPVERARAGRCGGFAPATAAARTRDPPPRTGRRRPGRHAESRRCSPHPVGAAGPSGRWPRRGPPRRSRIGRHRPRAAAPHTAPHDELVSVVRGLVEASPRRSVVIDTVANALKSRGFQRPPGSPRLVTRLRRIRELLVSPSGTITLADGRRRTARRAAGASRAPADASMASRPSAGRERAGETGRTRRSRWRRSRPTPMVRRPTSDGRQRARAAGDRRQPGTPEVDGHRRSAARSGQPAGGGAAGGAAAVSAGRPRGRRPPDPARLQSASRP